MRHVIIVKVLDMPADATPNQPLVGGVFRITMPVLWGEQDAMGHVNNAVYFRYVEEARIQLFYQAGIPLPAERSGVLAHASCDFIQPIVYPATVVVGLTLIRFGRTSIELETLITCHEDPARVYAKGRNVMVLLDGKTGRPTPWTEADMARLAQCFAAPAAV